MKSELVSLGNYICPTSVKACQSLSKKIQDYKKKRYVEARSCDFSSRDSNSKETIGCIPCNYKRRAATFASVIARLQKRELWYL